ncbi:MULTISPECIES: hypothetical protein [Luteimonas]|uniref:hypothetical protein n=1 Tax=Luteimonas TaxID=83614 RepID=UPI0018F3CEE3|nr:MULTISPECIES: hypothetical protein [Luteimonas]
MAKYLISFPAAAMVVPDEQWNAVVRESHAVIEEANKLTGSGSLTWAACSEGRRLSSNACAS